MPIAQETPSAALELQLEQTDAGDEDAGKQPFSPPARPALGEITNTPLPAPSATPQDQLQHRYLMEGGKVNGVANTTSK
jgi:hypothetical protein